MNYLAHIYLSNDNKEITIGNFIADGIKGKKYTEFPKEIQKGISELPVNSTKDPKPVKILTSCPSCLQGLQRYGDDTGTTADYIVVELAKHNLGEGWLEDYVEKATKGGIEKILL